MLAIRDKNPETKACSYSRCSVIEAPADLPDGQYNVTFEGCTVAVLREGGLWLVSADPLDTAA
ncbi:MAG TPA: hypothetical protein VHX60_14815 [Acidobacteriaceae bacterium]|jgi:hypothetical protein|nr:hypothetical protein [Acidobacteriaceae bacterium]